MRTKLLAKLSVIIAFMCGCSNEPLPEPIPPTPDVPKYLSIIPTISSVVETKAGIITQFVDDDRIGVFASDGELEDKYNGIDANNMPATFFKDKWTIASNLEVKSDGVAYAYYPYSKDVSNKAAIPIETASQTDYLYSGKEAFSLTQPQVTLKMKHALSLVSIRIRKNDYQKAGQLQKVELEGLQTTGSMDIQSGYITKIGGTSTVSNDVDITLDDNNLVKTETIILPINKIKDSPVKLKVTVDGNVFAFDVPEEHSWEAGFEYIYTVNLSKQPEEEPSIEFEREYWEKFGKNDNIKIVSNSAYPNLTIAVGSTPRGRTLVKGETYIFEPYLTNRNKTDFIGKIKLTLWDGDRIVEQYPAYNIVATKSFFTTFSVPSYINCDPGTYKLIPLFQKDGETDWFIPPYGGGVEDEDWMFTIQGGNKNPAIRSMNIEGYPAWPNTVRTVELNKPFNVEFSMTNIANNHLKGDIKVMIERTFTDEFRVKWLNDGNVYEDEIGRARIDIDTNTSSYNGVINCCITIQRDTRVNSGPSMHLYFKAEGSNEWIFLRSDADLALQKMKDKLDAQYLTYESEGMNYFHVALPKEN